LKISDGSFYLFLFGRFPFPFSPVTMNNAVMRGVMTRILGFSEAAAQALV
jgi:hypothetical protein